MAIQGDGGTFETVLRMRDEASAVVKDFAKEAGEALGGTEKATASSGKGFDALAASAKDGLKKVALGAAAASGAAAAFGIAMFKAGSQAADKADEVATKIGITTEQLTRLQYATGFTEGASNALSGALISMERNLSKSAEGGAKAATAALEGLGLSAGELIKLSPDEAFLRISDAIGKLEDPFQRAEAQAAVFGKAAAALIPVFVGGAEGARALMNEADQLGVVIDSKAAKAASNFNDALQRIRAELGGVTTVVTNNTAREFSNLAIALQKTIAESKVLDGVAILLTGTLKGVAFVGNTIGTAFGFAGRIIGGLAAVLAALARGEFREAVRAFSAMAKDLEEAAKRSGETYESILGLEKSPPKTPPSATTTPGPKQGRYFRKSGYEDEFGGSMIRTGGFNSDLYTYSDVNPGAELVGQQSEEAESALEQHFVRVEEKTRQHQIRLQAYDTSARAIRFQVGQRYDKLSLESSAFFFGQLGALMQTKSRALFEVGKAGAIAETIIQTYRAAQGAYAAMASIPFVGPALGAAAAAAAVAVGFARVQAIRSTSFGSASGSPVLSSGGFSGAVVSGGSGVVPFGPPQAAQQAQQVVPARTINVVLQGTEVYSAAAVRDSLIPALNDALGDGVTLNVRTA